MRRTLSLLFTVAALAVCLPVAAEVLDDVEPHEAESVLDAVILWEFDTEA